MKPHWSAELRLAFQFEASAGQRRPREELNQATRLPGAPGQLIENSPASLGLLAGVGILRQNSPARPIVHEKRTRRSRTVVRWRFTDNRRVA